MGIWHKECIKAHGMIKCYVEVQNDWTGVTLNQIREITKDGERYYIRCDGQKVDVTDDYNKLTEELDRIDRAKRIAGGFI